MSLQAKKLTKSYGKRRALQALDLEVAAGELVALVGENGAGKTTTIAMLSGRLVPDSGEALVGGFDVFTRPMAARRLLGYVAQELFAPPHLTIEELARFVCEIKEQPLDPRELDRLLVLTGMGGQGDRLIGELSHGMQRKAAWIVALVAAPTALLLDEGLAGLDAASSSALAQEIARRVQRGLAVLWTEHDLGLIAPAVTRVQVLRAGRLAETVSGEEIRELQAADRLLTTLRRWTEGGD